MHVNGFTCWTNKNICNISKKPLRTQWKISNIKFMCPVLDLSREENCHRPRESSEMMHQKFLLYQFHISRKGDFHVFIKHFWFRSIFLLIVFNEIYIDLILAFLSKRHTIERYDPCNHRSITRECQFNR